MTRKRGNLGGQCKCRIVLEWFLKLVTETRKNSPERHLDHLELLSPCAVREVFSGSENHPRRC